MSVVLSSVLRLYPNGPEQRFTVSPVSGCVGVTDVSVRSLPDGADPDPDPDPDPEAAVRRDPDADTESDTGPSARRPWQLEELPFEVLQHIASLLDSYR